MPPTTPFDEATKVALADANCVEFSRELARWSGASGEIAERDGVVLFATGSDFPVTCNGVVRLDRTVPAVDVLDLADAWFAERGRGYSVATWSLGGDDDLVAEALDRGLLAVLDTPAMICDERLVDRSLPDGVTETWAATTDDVADLVAICDAAYQSLGMPVGVIEAMVVAPEWVLAPHVQTVVLRGEAGEPLACAQLLLSHGIAGVYYVGTVEAARGRGLAEAATRAVTNLGFDLGAPFVTLQASPMGDPIYRRMGYREAYRYAAHTRFV